jgi:hypothetical protein
MDANFRTGNFPKFEPTADFAENADKGRRRIGAAN